VACQSLLQEALQEEAVVQAVEEAMAAPEGEDSLMAILDLLVAIMDTCGLILLAEAEGFKIHKLKT